MQRLDIYFFLGSTYMERVAGEPRTNKERAIYYYELALQIATRDALPEQYGILQTMLGRAYANRVEGERKDNLKPGSSATA